MARASSLARVAGGLLLVALLARASLARAQSLPRLRVESFTMATQPHSPLLDRTFHIVIVVQMKGVVRRLDTLTLPILSEVDLRGDERAISYANGTSTYRETLSVRAHSTGAIHLTPATLDAIDARTGQAEEYSSNSLTILVRGGALQPFGSAGSAVGKTAKILLWAALWALGFLVLLAILLALALYLWARTPPRRTLPEAAPAPPPPDDGLPAATREEQLRDALLVLRAEPTRASAMKIRIHVRGMIGASPRETLSDVLARLDPEDRSFAQLLIALERAAFTTEEDLNGAIAAVCAQFERLLS